MEETKSILDHKYEEVDYLCIMYSSTEFGMDLMEILEKLNPLTDYVSPKIISDKKKELFLQIYERVNTGRVKKTIEIVNELRGEL